MSVTGTSTVLTFPVQAGKDSGLYRWTGNLGISGDVSGGEYVFTWQLPAGGTPFPGRNYWIIDGCEFSASAAIAGPYAGFTWLHLERRASISSGYWSRQLYMSAFTSLTLVQVVQATNPFDAVYPKRWFAIDLLGPFASAYSFLTVSLGPNTNGSQLTNQVSGFFASEKYIQQNGLFLP